MAFDHNDLPLAFGPYTLLRRLAVGGMAEVYVAKTNGLGGFEKQVALKVIHPRFSEDEHFIKMLVEEAKISVLLTHVNIGQTLNLGVVDDVYYIAMEFIEGADAYRVMRRCAELKKAIPIDVATFIAAESCNGLDFAHRKRDPETGSPLHIIHRDVSPQNILISFNGEVKIVDFGIAKAASRSTQTEVGVIKGKYYYMSPEQAWGDPMTLTSDVFSTGVVLYELLTGRMLYADADVPTLLDKVRKAEIPRPETRRPSIPRELSDIVMKALAKNAEDRYASAAEMGEALHSFLYSISPTFTAARVADLVSLLFPAESPRSSATRLPTQSEGDEQAHDEEPTARGDALALHVARASRDFVHAPELSAQSAGVAVPQVLPGGAWAAPVASDPGVARVSNISRSGMDWSEEETDMNGVYAPHASPEPDFDDSTAVDSSAVKSLRLPPIATERRAESTHFVMDDTTNQMPAARAKAFRVQGGAAQPTQPAQEQHYARLPQPSPGEATLPLRTPTQPQPVRVQPPLAMPQSAPKPPSLPPPGRSVPPPKGRLPSQQPSGMAPPRAGAPRPMPSQAPMPRPAPQVAPPRPHVAPPQQGFLAPPQAQALAMPQQAMPQRAMPPQQAMPQQAMPQQAMSQQAMSQQQAMQWVPQTGERAELDASTSGPQSLEAPSYRAWWIASAVMLLVAACALTVAFLFRAQPPPPSLEITSIPPGAEVAVDGTRVGLVTPVVVPTGIELGHTYQVSVMLDGYEAAVVDVTPTEPLTRREVMLRPRLSRLRIETEPPGASVFARGAPRGPAPIMIDGLRMGEVVEVRVEAPGFQPLTQQFNVSAPDSVATLRLERLP